MASYQSFKLERRFWLSSRARFSILPHTPGFIALGEELRTSMTYVAKILILEDDENLRDILAKVLRGEGYDVTAVDRGEAAVERASQESFDLMIADIRMEGMDGLEALEKAQSLQPDIGSLVVSGYASERDTARAERLQVGGYLTKPFKMRDLLNYVRKQLKNLGSPSQASSQDRFLEQAIDWSLNTLAKGLDEAKLFQGSLLQASRQAEAICLRLNLPPNAALAARWATVILGASRMPEIEIPRFALKPNKHFPELHSLLTRLTSESGEDESEGVAADRSAVQLCLEVALDTEDGKLHPDHCENHEVEVVEAFRAVKVELTGKAETPLEVRLGLDQAQRSKSSLLILAKTFERAGDQENADKAFRSLWTGSDESKWRLEGALGLARLSASTGQSQECRTASLQALKLAKKLGPWALASSGLEAALWLESLSAPEFEKALQIVDRAAQDLGQSIPRALLRLAGERLNGPAATEDDVRLLTSPAATNELSRYTPWLFQHLFSRVESNLTLSSDLLHRLVGDFPLEFLRALQQPGNSPDLRIAICKVLSESRYLPRLVLDALSEAPEAAIQEIAQNLKAKSDGETASGLVRVYSFGNLELISGGETLDEKGWKTRKVKFLFAKLAAEWGRPLPITIVLETFWPEERSRKKKNLYWAVTTLRRILRGSVAGKFEPLIREADTLNLLEEFPRWHDLEEFEKVTLVSQNAMERKDYESVLACGHQISRLYRGEYLEGCYYDFAVTKRESLIQDALSNYTRAAEAALNLGLSEQAVELAALGVEIAPYRQEAHALKMRGHIRLHQPAEAINQFHKVEKILKLEYDVEPSTELLEYFHRARLGFTDA